MATLISVAPPSGNSKTDMAAIDAAIKAANAEYMRNSGGGQVTVKLDDGFNARINGIVRTALTDVSNVLVSNLTIDGNRANNTDHQAGFNCGAKAEENKVQSDIALSKIEIRNCTAYGFNPHEITTNVTIENCVSHGNGLGGFVADIVHGLAGNDTYIVNHSGDVVVDQADEERTILSDRPLRIP